MHSGKKEQFESKLRALKESIQSKHNMDIILRHDSDVAMKNQSYGNRLQYLTIMKVLTEFRNKPIEKFTEADLKEFFSQLRPMGAYIGRLEKLSPKTKWMYMCLVKSFFKWHYNAEEEGAVVPEVVRWIRRKKYVGFNKKLLPSEILTPDEVLELVRSAPFTRDAAFIFSLFESGCRVASEFLKLKIKDVRANGRYACFDVKGDLKTAFSERTCYLIRSWPDVRNWLNVHPCKNNPEAPLWVSIKGKTFGQELAQAGATHIIERAKSHSKLQKRVFPHLLRHSRALECAKKGYNNQVMNKMFGWSDGSDMASWYISLSQSDVKDVILAKEGLASEIKQEQSIRRLDLIICPKCEREWGAGTKFCTCGFVLDVQEANKVDLQKDEKALELMKVILKNMKVLEQRGIDPAKIGEFIEMWSKAGPGSGAISQSAK